MIGIPEKGDRVKVWPFPGRAVQHGSRPLDDGGRWLKGPTEVDWNEFYLEQYRAGDLLLHAPPEEKKESKKFEEPKKGKE